MGKEEEEEKDVSNLQAADAKCFKHIFHIVYKSCYSKHVMNDSSLSKTFFLNMNHLTSNNKSQ